MIFNKSIKKLATEWGSKEETGSTLEIETAFAREGNRDKLRFSA